MDGTKKKHPTDAQILSNLFFTFLNVEAANQTEDKQQIYRNFVFKTNTNISKLENLRKLFIISKSLQMQAMKMCISDNQPLRVMNLIMILSLERNFGLPTQ